jgi:hypothetical protein
MARTLTSRPAAPFVALCGPFPDVAALDAAARDSLANWEREYQEARGRLAALAAKTTLPDEWKAKAGKILEEGHRAGRREWLDRILLARAPVGTVEDLYRWAGLLLHALDVAARAFPMYEFGSRFDTFRLDFSYTNYTLEDPQLLEQYDHLLGELGGSGGLPDYDRLRRLHFTLVADDVGVMGLIPQWRRRVAAQARRHLGHVAGSLGVAGPQLPSDVGDEDQVMAVLEQVRGWCREQGAGRLRSAASQADGPVAGGRFRLNGKLLNSEFTNLEAKLLACLWDSELGRPTDKVTYEEVIRYLYDPKGYGGDHDNAIKQVRKRLNGKLREDDPGSMLVEIVDGDGMRITMLAEADSGQDGGQK